MADTNKMQTMAIAVIALAVVVLLGMAIVGSYGKILRTNTAVTNQTVTANNETYTRFGVAGTYPFLQTLPTCFNASNTSDTLAVNTDYSILEGDADGGYILLLDIQYNNTPINCTGTYLADTSSSGVADSFNTGMAIFGTFMAVIVLAIVGKIIIGLFSKKN